MIGETPHTFSDEIIRQGRVGLLCNQTAFNPADAEYLFQTLDRRGSLKRLFVPEHGLFSELQDQVTLDSTQVYAALGLSCEIVSLYGSKAGSVRPVHRELTDLDALIIDLPHVGSRYFTYITTMGYLFEELAGSNSSLAVFVVDYANPAGRQVEGIPLAEEYASFVGYRGIPHRYGLTMGELARVIRHDLGGTFDLRIVSPDWLGGRLDAGAIAPSPNLPTAVTPLLYSGQCLWEATNLSEGRGTTRPFEIFGAPYLSWPDGRWPKAAGSVLRPVLFMPVFDRYAGEICRGFQLHLTGEPYHSLAHSLRLIRHAREVAGDDFGWRPGAFEKGSTRTALEVLAGDSTLIDYLNGRCGYQAVQTALADGESAWMKKTKPFLAQREPLTRVSRSVIS
ncbi:MAG: DUF1343 domain-containing protein [Candidatus Marinimicrobia bacterium]|nr:DUF1343 domain-containing protein [Candidatus Neomarinimicrobiota bacterium]